MRVQLYKIASVRTKAFTLTEVIFTMLLSTLVILSGLGAIEIINKLIKRSSSLSLVAGDLLTLRSQLDFEINSAKRIEQTSANSFAFLFRDSESSEYTITDDYVLRESSWNIDTIKIKCRVENFELISNSLIKTFIMSSTIQSESSMIFFVRGGNSPWNLVKTSSNIGIITFIINPTAAIAVKRTNEG